MTAPAGARAPRPGLPLAYLATAATAFLAAALALPWLADDLAGHYYQPRLLALTHIVTLGWITLAIMGASCQLIPTVFERPLASERLARWQLPILALGVAGVAGHFAAGGAAGFVASAALVSFGALTHVVNAGRSLAGVRAEFAARMMRLALAGLGLTALFGALLGIGRAWPILPVAPLPRLHAHVQLALLGWTLPTVLGVTARVYPLFLHAPAPGPAAERVQLAGIAAGVPAVVAGLLAGLPPLVALGGLAVGAAVAAHLAAVFAMARASRRQRLDWGLRFVLAGAGFLTVALPVGLALAVDLAGGPRATLAWAALVLGGWLSLTIAGMALKIVSFLVWYRVYAPRAGREAVPTLAELGLPGAEAAALVLLAVGFAALAAGVGAGAPELIRAAGMSVALGALAFAAALGRVLAHLRPRAHAPESAATAPVRA